MPFPLSSNQNEKGNFPYVSSEKTYSFIVTSSAIDKMFKIFGPIFEQNANFGPIFEKV